MCPRLNTCIYFFIKFLVLNLEIYFYFLRKELKLDSQPQGVDTNLEGLAVVACINKVIFVVIHIH